MPAYNSYGAITELLADDILLVWQDGSSSNRTIAFSDLVDSVQSLLSRSDSVSIVSGNTTLSGSSQFVVGNSGSAITLELPDASDNPGQTIKISNKGAGTITVERSGTDAIAASGAVGASVEIPQYESYSFISDGVDTWFRSS